MYVMKCQWGFPAGAVPAGGQLEGDQGGGLAARLGGESKGGNQPSRFHPSILSSEAVHFFLPEILPLTVHLLSLAMRVTSLSLPNFPLQVVASSQTPHHPESNQIAPPN